MLTLTTRQIPGAIKAGRIKETYKPEGDVLCSVCKCSLGRTASPSCWSKGDKVHCDGCGCWVLALPTYADCTIDLSR